MFLSRSNCTVSADSMVITHRYPKRFRVPVRYLIHNESEKSFFNITNRCPFELQVQFLLFDYSFVTDFNCLFCYF